MQREFAKMASHVINPVIKPTFLPSILYSVFFFFLSYFFLLFFFVLISIPNPNAKLSKKQRLSFLKLKNQSKSLNQAGLWIRI